MSLPFFGIVLPSEKQVLLSFTFHDARLTHVQVVRIPQTSWAQVKIYSIGCFDRAAARCLPCFVDSVSSAFHHLSATVVVGAWRNLSPTR